MLAFVITLLFTLIASAFLERFVVPKATSFNANTLLLHGLIISILFLTLTLIVQRPIFSALTILIFQAIVLAVNRAKFIALKEPLVFSDFAMFSQAFKHPRLYFPFLGMAPVIIAPVLILALIISVLWLEPSLPFTMLRILLTLAAIAVLFFISKDKAEALKLSTKPELDNARYGLVNTLYAYTLQARSPAHKQQIIQALQNSPFAIITSKLNAKLANEEKSSPTPPHFYTTKTPDKNIKPNITVIQSESFFDARRLHPHINTDLLKHFDACNAASRQYGKLKVPAWGANTMRSEFAFLTGLPFENMGLYRYYPYQFIHQMPVSSIASILQTQGYYCVCIHPHPASFFGREQLFPKMGFDEFIDIGSFEGAEKFGPYISDQAVTEKIVEITEQMTHKPLFIFAITMENHGPLHLEKTARSEHPKYYSKPIPKVLNKTLNDLTVYLRHLKNADKMIKTLTDYYRQPNQTSKRDTTLCFYGDHVPSIPNIYQATGYEDDHSDYFIWQSNQTNSNTQKDIAIEALASSLLKIKAN